MNWAQIFILVALGINLLIASHKHGEPQEDYNFWRTLIGAAIAMFIYWKAGLFTPLN